MKGMILTKGAQLFPLTYQFNITFQQILLDSTISKQLFYSEDEQEQ